MKLLLRLLFSLAAGWVLLGALREFALLPQHNLWSNKYDLLWQVSFFALAAFSLAVLLGLLLAAWAPRRLERPKMALVRMRQRLGVWRWVIIALAALLPLAFLLFTIPGLLFASTFIRLAIGLSAAFLLAALLTRSDTELVQPETLAFGLLFYTSLHILAWRLTLVTGYPFSLSWSEGNRFYDYSVILGGGRYIYEGKLTIPYDSPGRYLLWGLLFALPDTPIWLHRLWDAMIWTVPYLLFGWLLGRWSGLSRLVKACFALWVFLFLFQGPIYSPLILSAILVVLTVQPKRLWLAVIGVFLAGFYASISRFTWMFMPAIWAVLILLSRLEIAGNSDRGAADSEKIAPRNRSSGLIRKLIPVALVGLAGALGGLLPNSEWLSPANVASSHVAQQPLLWYRLLPNATYSEGILVGILFAAGPLAAWLVWTAAIRWQRVNWLQGLAYLAAGLATLAVGLVASTKIGGGSNLHNLDMFLVTLALLAGIWLAGKNEIPWKSWPWWGQLLLLAVVILPSWRLLDDGKPLRLPKAEKTTAALAAIQQAAGESKDLGEVLFLDQRQLLAFGYVQDLPLVADYEKKYLMDQAMAGNEAYFKQFYADLARQRFSLIVTEPLRVVERGLDDDFGEENNAWVQWVAEPLLCYYEAVASFKENRVELLKPRQNPTGCPE